MYMLISPPQKATNIILGNITRKTHIKYSGVFIDEHLNWGPQILHINHKVSRNMGIINKLKYYLNIRTLTQLYYILIYPYLSYGITNWGNTYKSRLNKLISKQSNCIRNIFFAHSRESHDPYYKLLDFLKLDNIFKLKIATVTHKIHNNKECIPVIFFDFVLPAASIHSHNTRYASDQNLYRIHVRTNINKRQHF